MIETHALYTRSKLRDIRLKINSVTSIYILNYEVGYGMRMMIRIGVDNVAISRFDKCLLSNIMFLNRCFTLKEQDYCFLKSDPSTHFAVRFAAKEAVIKALSGFNLILEHNKIEITNDAKGRPSVSYLCNEPIYSKLRTDISLSHSKTSAIAFVVIYS